MPNYPELNPSQKFVTRSIIELAITIPELKSPEFLSMVELAKNTPLHIASSQVANLAEESREDFETVRHSLHPFNINKMIFLESVNIWPTIGSVQAYIFELLTGAEQDSMLVAEVGSVKVGRLAGPALYSSLNISENVHHLVPTILDSFVQNIPVHVKSKMETWSIDELKMIKEQFHINAIANNSNTGFRDSVFILAKEFNPDPLYIPVINSCAVRLAIFAEGRIEDLEHLINSNIVKNDTGLIRSAPKERLIDFAQELKDPTGAVIGTVLSVLPHEERESMLDALGIDFSDVRNEQITFKFQLGLLIASQPRNWASILSLRGFSEGLKRRLRWVSNSSILEYLDAIPLETINQMGDISPIVDAISSSAYSDIRCLQLMSSRIYNRIEFFTSVSMLHMLSEIPYWSKENIFLLIKIINESRLNIDQYLRFMKSDFFETHVLQKGLFAEIMLECGTDPVRAYFVDSDVELKLPFILRRQVDLILIFSVLDDDSMSSLLSNQANLLLIKNIPVSIHVLLLLKIDLSPLAFSKVMIATGWEAGYAHQLESPYKRYVEMKDVMLAQGAAVGSPQFVVETTRLLANEFTHDTTGDYINDMGCFLSFNAACSFMSFLPSSTLQRFLLLPGQEKVLLVESPLTVDEFIEVSRLIYKFEPENLIILLTSPAFSGQVVSLLKLYSFWIFIALGAHLSEFLDMPSMQDHLSKTMSDEVAYGFVLTMQSDFVPIPGISEMIEIMFKARSTQSAIPHLLVSGDVFAMALKYLGENKAFSFITGNKNISDRYVQLVSEGKADPLFAVLMNTRGTREQELALLKATEEGYNRHDAQQTEVLAQYTRNTTFSPLPMEEDRPFLTLLRERTRSVASYTIS